jgi:hypothetical protein
MCNKCGVTGNGERGRVQIADQKRKKRPLPQFCPFAYKPNMLTNVSLQEQMLPYVFKRQLLDDVWAVSIPRTLRSLLQSKLGSKLKEELPAPESPEG